MRIERRSRKRVLRVLRMCQERLEKDIGDADAWFSKGLALAKLKKYKQALHCFNRVARIKVNYPAVWRLKATVYALMGDQRMSFHCKKVAERLEAKDNIGSIERIPASKAA